MIKIKILQPRQQSRTNSFFYEGAIASTENKGYEYKLIANGDIRLFHKDGRRIYNSNAGIEFIMTDSELNNAEKDGWEWENNNWFEIICRKKGSDGWNDELGDVAYSYKAGIELLKKYAQQGIK